MAFLIGAFLGTFLVTRFWLWCAKDWPDSYRKIVFIYANYFCALVLLDGYARSSEQGFNGSYSFYNYLFPTLAIMAFDIVRVYRGKPL